MFNFENIQRIAYLGPQGSFCEMAKDYFEDKFRINAYSELLPTISDVIKFIDDNQNVLAVLPVENSVSGTVRETLDNLMTAQNPNLKILAEFCMPINHCLLSRTTEVYSISNIISSPHSLAHCREFIKNEMPYNVNIVEAATSSEAARNLQGYNLTYASIGTPKTAEIFNLNILKENINDDKSNQTRFVLIGDFDTKETGNDKTSIAFSTDNKPGALLNVLNIFLKNQVNLTYIASCPSKNNFGKYIFVVNFDGHINNPQIIETLRQVKEKTPYMKYFGSYRKAKVVVS